MSDTPETLRVGLKDPEYSEGYAESFLDSYIATQIKVLREQHGLSQQGLAELIGTRQGVISRIENVNYSKWNVSTLKKLARAFRVRLKVSFETYGSLLADVDGFSRAGLQRAPREKDPILHAASLHVERDVPRGIGAHFHVFISHSYKNAPGQLQHQLFDLQQEQVTSLRAPGFTMGCRMFSQAAPSKPPASSALERVMQAAG